MMANLPVPSLTSCKLVRTSRGEPCEGGAVSLTITGFSGASYQWFGPQSNLVSTEQNLVFGNVQPSASGDYYVVASLGGCTASSSPITLAVLGVPDIQTDNASVDINGEVEFSVIENDLLDTQAGFSVGVLQDVPAGQLENLGNGIFQFIPEPDFVGTVNFIYEICYKDCPLLCDFGFVNLTVEYQSQDCIATTIFTPNGDGVNEYFKFFCLENGGFSDNELLVFNQWGDQVFAASPYENDWSGTYNGKELPGGTYFYVFKPGAGLSEKKGFLTIMR